MTSEHARVRPLQTFNSLDSYSVYVLFLLLGSSAITQLYQHASSKRFTALDLAVGERGMTRCQSSAPLNGSRRGLTSQAPPGSALQHENIHTKFIAPRLTGIDLCQRSLPQQRN